MDISTYLKQTRSRVDQAMDACLPTADTRPVVLHEGMRYAVFNGGKRIRPILCIAAAEAFGAKTEAAMPAAMAVELFHCSTLVHDDLPCMDDDSLRRGMPTCHIRFGEANAVLIGDALMIHAFQVLARSDRPELSLELARAAGSLGVIAGQVEDLAAENTAPSADLVEFIHLHKTADLIRAAVRMGAITGGATPEELKHYTDFGEKIGIAFQIADDILDETSTDEVLGKPAGSDLEKNKLTYPAVYGIDQAKARICELTAEAVSTLDLLKQDNAVLQTIAELLVTRTF
jgi:geranylgeranyl diphosphate synthase type II